MSAIEIFLGFLVALAVIEIAIIFAGFGRATREIRALHATIDSANSGPLVSAWIPYPAAWRVQEKSGPLMLCEPHLEQHDQERGASFIPLEPALAGSQCAACLREAAILRARAA